ncbi:MAG: GNAT family N-acetyltransferase [Rubricella sp.]
MIPPHECPIPGPAADFATRLAAQLPVIETERLILRAPCIDDFAIYLAIADEDGEGNFVPEGADRADIWLDFTQMVATWLLRGHGAWAVDLRETGETLGFVLIGFEPGDHEPELGYLFLRKAGGKGYATEAARAARDYAFGTAGLPALVSAIEPGNSRSASLAERLGAQRDRAAEAAHAHAALIYRHSPTEARP